MKDYTLAIFDLDGTILDTSEGILASVAHTIKQLNLPQLNQEELSTFIGPPIQDSFAGYYGLSGASLQEAADIFRNNYSTCNLLAAKPYDGIYAVFDFLHEHNILSAVATYKREDYALKLLKHFSFDKYTDILFGADNENKLKKKDIIIKCLEKSKVKDLRKVIVIGDTYHDATGAANLNLDFMAVTYGFGFKKGDDLSPIKSVASVDTPLEIIDFFNKCRYI
jgi:phosphoglycolate phosphatase